MDSDILKQDTTGANPASNINPDEPPEPISLDDIHNTAVEYFTSQSPFLQKSYEDGAIQLTKDKFDVITFMNTILRLSVNSIKRDNKLTDAQNIQLDQLVDVFNSLLTLLRSVGVDKTTLDCVVTTFSYCLNSYKKYNKVYDRSKKIPE